MELGRETIPGCGIINGELGRETIPGCGITVDLWSLAEILSLAAEL